MFDILWGQGITDNCLEPKYFLEFSLILLLYPLPLFITQTPASFESSFPHLILMWATGWKQSNPKPCKIEKEGFFTQEEENLWASNINIMASF